MDEESEGITPNRNAPLGSLSSATMRPSRSVSRKMVRICSSTRVPSGVGKTGCRLRSKSTVSRSSSSLCSCMLRPDCDTLVRVAAARKF